MTKQRKWQLSDRAGLVFVVVTTLIGAYLTYLLLDHLGF